MSTITNVRRLCVYRCRMRGRAVDIIYSDDLDAPNNIVDTATRETLRWTLTPQEESDLADVVFELYQPAGVK